MDYLLVVVAAFLVAALIGAIARLSYENRRLRDVIKQSIIDIRALDHRLADPDPTPPEDHVESGRGSMRVVGGADWHDPKF